MQELTLSQKRSLAGKKGGMAKRGKKSPRVLEREEAIRQYRERISGLTESLLNAQLTLALGCSYLYKAVGNKKILVKDESEIRAFLNGEYEGTGVEYDYITTKTPNREAIRDILDRTFGRPTESVQVASHHIHEHVPIQINYIVPLEPKI